MFDFENSNRYALKTVNLTDQSSQNVIAFQKEIEMLQKLQYSERVIKLVDLYVLIITFLLSVSPLLTFYWSIISISHILLVYHFY